MQAQRQNWNRPSLPHGWPTDNRSRVYSVDDMLFLTHPERPKHILDGMLWKRIPGVK